MKTEYVTCKKCLGIGYIEVYKHRENGVCYSCRGTGNKKFFKNQEQLTGVFHEMLTHDDLITEKQEVLHIFEVLIDDYFRYNNYLDKSLVIEDESEAFFYQMKINEVMTGLYNLKKTNNKYVVDLIDLLEKELFNKKNFSIKLKS